MKIRVQYLLLAYVIAIGIMLLYWNENAGGAIQEWYRYWLRTGEGSTHERELRMFAGFALDYGTWVYPFSVIAIILFLRQSQTEKTRFQKLACLICACVCLFFLGAFLKLGVFKFGWAAGGPD